MTARWLVMLGAMAGMAVAFLWPAGGSANQVHYILQMDPPASNWGANPHLNCGWHDGCIPYQEFTGSGVGLDWAYQTNYTVWFRGWGYKNGAPLENSRLRGHPWQLAQPGQCDFVDVQVFENPSTLRFDLQYYHANLQSTADFPILTADYKALNNYWLANMIDDDPFCSTGRHVHETHLPPGPPVIASWNAGLYPTWQVCNARAVPDCLNYWNSTILYSTRAFDWYSS